MKINITKNVSLKVNKQILTLFLILIQSCGILFFEKKGIILLVIILYLSRSGFKYLTTRHLRNLGLILFFLIVNKLLNYSFTINKLIFVIGLIVESYIFLLAYTKSGIKILTDDLYHCLKLIFANSIIGYALYCIIPFAFIDPLFNYPYKTFLYLFYVADSSTGLIRNTGLMWEPGLLQLMLNILLFLSIQKKKPSWVLLLIASVIIVTFSTTGYICLLINYILYIITNFREKKKLVFTLIALTVLSSSFLFFIWANVKDKLGGENLSGLARYRDLYIGIELIKEKPIIGHGIFDESYLQSKPYVSKIESSLFGDDTIKIIGTISGGYVNGFLSIFAWFGFPMGAFIFYLLLKNKIVNESATKKILFVTILCFTFFAEPITYTAFFLIFPLSSIIYREKAKFITATNFR